MLQGLALTPPVIGRITIGKLIERNGKTLPEKDDEFTITSQVQSAHGWVPHPLDAALRQASTNGNGNAKLRSIPVRLLFDEPELNLRSSYSCFDRQTGRPICVGNGETCKRSTSAGIQSRPCPTPSACEVGQGGQCKPYGRLHVRVPLDAIGQKSVTNEAPEATGVKSSSVESDELGSLVFRTTGYNSIRTLSARLAYFQAVSGGLLSNLPLELRLRGKSTAMSYWTPIYFVDLVVQGGLSLTQAIAQARRERQERTDAGWDQAALDEAARRGYQAGAFEESEEEGVGVVQEFFPSDTESSDPAPSHPAKPARLSLTQKLDQRRQRQALAANGGQVQ